MFRFELASQAGTRQLGPIVGFIGCKRYGHIPTEILRSISGCGVVEKCSCGRRVQVVVARKARLVFSVAGQMKQLHDMQLTAPGIRSHTHARTHALLLAMPKPSSESTTSGWNTEAR